MAATISSALPSPKPSHPLLVNAYTNKKKEATLKASPHYLAGVEILYAWPLGTAHV